MTYSEDILSKSRILVNGYHAAGISGQTPESVPQPELHTQLVKSNRSPRKLQLVTSTLRTMGCLPKFFCGNSKLLEVIKCQSYKSDSYACTCFFNFRNGCKRHKMERFGLSNKICDEVSYSENILQISVAIHI